MKLQFQWLVFVIGEPLVSHAVHALVSVKQIGSHVPSITQGINIKFVFKVTLFDYNLALRRRGISYLGISYTIVFEKLAEVFLMIVRHLDDHTRILCKEHLDNVLLFSVQVIKVHTHTAFNIGERHFEQRGNQSTGRNVVPGHNPSFLDQLLNGVKAVGKVFRIPHGWHVTAYLAKCLSKGRSTQSHLIKGEVNIVER